MKKIKQVQQLIQTECGLCCIAMISRFYNSFIRLNQLREYLEPGRDGIDIRSMANLLTALDFECKVYKLNANDIGQLSLPSILYWEEMHFVVLESITKKSIVIVDPALGRMKISREDFEKKFSNVAISAKPNADFKKVKKEKSIWLHYSYLILKSKKLLAYIFLLSIMLYGFSLVLPMLTQFIIDNVKSFNIKLILGITSVLISYIAVSFVNSKMQVIFKTKLFGDFAKHVYSHLIKIPYNYFELRSYGNLLFSLESIEIVKNLYSEKLVKFFIDIGTITTLLIYLLIKAPKISISIFVILLIMAIVLRLLSNKILALNQVEISSLTKLKSIQIELIYSILNIKIAGIEDKVYNTWNEQFEYTLDKTQKRDFCQNYYSMVSNALQTILPISVLFFGLNLYLKNIYTLGEVIAFYTIVNTICMYAIGIFTTMNFFELSSQYLERVKDITDQEVERNGDKILGDNFKGKICLRDVSFSYSKHSQMVLKNINIDMEFGKKIAFVGSSGSGKSTLGKIILGLYETMEGSVYYDGIDLKEIDKSHLRKIMGIVPQDTSLFNKTIQDNITMNRSDITDTEIKEACRIAQIDKEIENMPMKYNTLISDMGMNVSGGQRQRIVLARALVSSPKIILFDEATSALDSINEKNISLYLKEKGCTRIIIAHRLSTIVDADIIFVMENGEIVEQGTHEYLLSKGGKYERLYNTNEDYAS